MADGTKKALEEAKSLQQALTKEQLKVAEWAALILQKNWRAYKTRKEMNKSASGRFGQQKRFDPFSMMIRKDKSIAKGGDRKALGTFNYHDERICIQCDDETATRQTLIEDDNLWCTKCFTE